MIFSPSKLSVTNWSVHTTMLVGIFTSTVFVVAFYLMLQLLMSNTDRAREVVYNSIYNDQALCLSGEENGEERILKFKVKDVHPVYEMALQRSVNGKEWSTVSSFKNERLLRTVKQGSFVQIGREEEGALYRTMIRCNVGWLKSGVVNFGNEYASQ